MSVEHVVSFPFLPLVPLAFRPSFRGDQPFFHLPLSLRQLHSFPTRRSSDLEHARVSCHVSRTCRLLPLPPPRPTGLPPLLPGGTAAAPPPTQLKTSCRMDRRSGRMGGARASVMSCQSNMSSPSPSSPSSHWPSAPPSGGTSLFFTSPSA